MNQQEYEVFKNKQLMILKRSNAIISRIASLNITDDELWNSFAEFAKIAVESQMDKSKLISMLEVKRDEQGKITFYNKFLDNQVAKKFLIDNNLELSFVSEIDTTDLFSEKKLSESGDELEASVDFSLYSYQITFKRFLQTNKKIRHRFRQKGLYLYGNFYSKREQYLKEIANDFAYANFQTSYINISDLYNFIISGFKSDTKNNSYSPDFLIKKMSEVEVLVLDGFGAQKINSWFLENVILKVLIQRMRHQNEKITFIGGTSNLEHLKKSTIKQYENDSRNKNHIEENMSIFVQLVQKITKDSFWIGSDLED
ncbi:hypothetical protein [Mycoplasmopsis gallinacea]|uniref:Primosomal protein DnaI n=1 Tax=Mycoplasmopsis gallinacea TaxID=29556 RepID=A0A6H0V5J0_9BACT|nr:hypothetical protein [Mycoplasmopsis gallinacea]QIW62297.1 hypothetical protein GOQ20_02555 [Mycoplasmopsis gallinacea]